MTFRRLLTPTAEQVIQDQRQARRDAQPRFWTPEELDSLRPNRNATKDEDANQLESAPGSIKRRR